MRGLEVLAKELEGEAEEGLVLKGGCQYLVALGGESRTRRGGGGKLYEN